MTGTDELSGFERCLFPYDFLAARVDNGLGTLSVVRVRFTESERSKSDADPPEEVVEIRVPDLVWREFEKGQWLLLLVCRLLKEFLDLRIEEARRAWVNR